jgi:hypothetical protein
MRYRVQPGDCLASIAFANGFTPKTLWEHADNAPLREKRASPFVLVPGDEVEIPAVREKQMECATGKRHRFQRRAVPERFRVRLCADGAPRKNVAYSLDVDGTPASGQTDGEGWLEHFIPPDARRAVVIVETEDEREELRFELGHLQPVTTEDGVRGRLVAIAGMNPRGDATVLREALRSFQMAQKLPPTGELDDDTRARLVREYGS